MMEELETEIDGILINGADIIKFRRNGRAGAEAASVECRFSSGLVEGNRVALVVFLRGVNVGGHRTFRPTQLAEALKHLGAVNIGAAGTLVIRKPMTQARARAEVARKLPFVAEIVVCKGGDIAGLISKNPFKGQTVRRGVVRFVSVLSQRPRLSPSTPMRFPSTGQWLMKIITRRNRFVIGMYRRHMKVIGFLGALDRLYGVSVTTRNWNTIATIAGVVRNDRSD
jgi:uncharacterized protein (DUF1697 family)